MDPTTDLSIDQSIDFGSTAAAFPADREILPLSSSRMLHC